MDYQSILKLFRVRMVAVLALASLGACSQHGDSGPGSRAPAAVPRSPSPAIIPKIPSAAAAASSASAPLPSMEASSGVAPVARPKSTVRRELYEGIIEKQFPGFRIMQPADFDESVRSDVQDGVGGALVVGDFDYDTHKDFAALLIGGPKDVAANAAHPEKIFKGLWVICHGSEDASRYACEEFSKQDVYVPEASVLTIIPPGAYHCQYNAEDAKEISTTIDGIGDYSESAGGFVVLQRDGSYFRCDNSD